MYSLGKISLKSAAACGAVMGVVTGITFYCSAPRKTMKEVITEQPKAAKLVIVKKEQSVNSGPVPSTGTGSHDGSLAMADLSPQASAPAREYRLKRKSSMMTGGKGSRCFGLGGGAMGMLSGLGGMPVHNTEQYAHLPESGFKNVLDDPLSTFSIDVDAASYSNTRRMLMEGRMPVPDAVRIEEMINYFTYDYPQPDGKHPFSITTEAGPCPWNKDNILLHIGLQGKKVVSEEMPPSNLVFLMDVSGSMNAPGKLPLLKNAFRLLVNNLRAQDRVAIAVYAGAAGLVLPSTSGSEKNSILAAIDRLQAGGSTAGGAGIKLAYETAVENFIKKGNNRVILATDGDFNVGASSDGELVRMIEKKRQKGVFLTVLGFGTGNYKDAKMEQLADKGNGNYAYIDNILEAKKVLVNEMGATLLTVAKDVKLQVEFNPAAVKEYRLIGYENRRLENRDFDDDKKDAGEMGAGHTVTALYELVPGNAQAARKLRYQKTAVRDNDYDAGELGMVKFRYKKPDGHKSRLLSRVIDGDGIKGDDTSDNFGFSAAVAGFGMLLRGSEYRASMTYADVRRLAKKSRGEDDGGYRAEFIRLVETAAALAPRVSSTD